MFKKIETEEDVSKVASMASSIWQSHFGPMFEQEELTKLIEAIQSKQAIKAQIEDG